MNMKQKTKVKLTELFVKAFNEAENCNEKAKVKASAYNLNILIEDEVFEGMAILNHKQ